MLDLVSAYWWLAFPLSWFVITGWRNGLAYRANRDTMDVIKSYVRNGRTPPPELIVKLRQV